MKKIIIKISGNLLFSEDGILNKKYLSLLLDNASLYFKKIFIFYGGGDYIKRRVRQSYSVNDYLNENDKNNITLMLDNIVSQLNEWNKDKLLTIVNINSVLYQRNDDLILTRNKIQFDSSMMFCNNILFNGKKNYFPSSDEIVAQLSKYINPDILLFLTEVDGVYYPFPYESNQLPLAEINTNNRKNMQFETYFPGLSNMSQKVDWAMLASTFSRQTIIANGNNVDNINCIFSGRPFIGTKIKNEG